jgi:virginiamycin B lyase
VAPSGIATAPDGTIWFTEDPGNSIGHETLSGMVSEFAAPPNDVQGIAVATDGIVWFTENGANKIGRMVPTTGAFTDFPIPNVDGQVVNIVAAADGKLWFTEEVGNMIGRVTP